MGLCTIWFSSFLFKFVLFHHVKTLSCKKRKNHVRFSPIAKTVIKNFKKYFISCSAKSLELSLSHLFIVNTYFGCSNSNSSFCNTVLAARALRCVIMDLPGSKHPEHIKFVCTLKKY